MVHESRPLRRSWPSWAHPPRGAAARRVARAHRAPGPSSPVSSRHGWTFAPSGAAPNTTRNGSSHEVAESCRKGGVVTANRASAHQHSLALAPRRTWPSRRASSPVIPLARTIGHGDDARRACSRPSARRRAVQSSGAIYTVPTARGPPPSSIPTSTSTPEAFKSSMPDPETRGSGSMVR